MPGGRPLKFSSVEDLQSKIDAYFDSCYQEVVERDKDGNVIYNSEGKPMIYRAQIEPFTITGLALALDTTRETLMDIEDGNRSYTERFSDAVKKAKLRCQNYAEKQIFMSKNPAGAIFALKNYGWKDKQDIDVSIAPKLTENPNKLLELRKQIPVIEGEVEVIG